MRQSKLLSILLAGLLVTFGMSVMACAPDAEEEVIEDEAVEESWEDTGEMVEEETDMMGDEMEEMGDEFEDDAEEYGDELEDDMEDMEDGEPVDQP